MPWHNIFKIHVSLLNAFFWSHVWKKPGFPVLLGKITKQNQNEHEVLRKAYIFDC